MRFIADQCRIAPQRAVILHFLVMSSDFSFKHRTVPNYFLFAGVILVFLTSVAAGGDFSSGQSRFYNCRGRRGFLLR
jgi:Flp pilus assembly protein protease CpaA